MEKKGGFFLKFNKLYPSILKFLNGFSKVIFTFMKTFLTSIGVFIILSLILVVEINRVQGGVAIFEASNTMAMFGSTVLVMLNLVIEFVIHYIENENGYSVPENFQSSIRLMFNKFTYFLGIGEWEALKSSPALNFHKLQRLITATIIVLALGGSMHSEMLVYSEITWYNAFVKIMTNSNIETIFMWTGGILFTLVMVSGSRLLSRYIAMVALEAEVEVFKRAKAIKDHEDGKVFLTPNEASMRYKDLYQFNWHEKDKLQIAPTKRFYDGESKTWSREYKSQQTLINRMKKVNMRRVSHNEQIS